MDRVDTPAALAAIVAPFEECGRRAK